MRETINKTSLVFIVGIMLFAIFGSYLPDTLHSVLYALSLTIKALILFILPFLIFCLLSRTIAQLASQATSLIFLLFITLCLSNYISTMFSYCIAELAHTFPIWTGAVLESQPIIRNFDNGGEVLVPFWEFHLTPIVSNNVALIFGVSTGAMLASCLNLTITKQVLSGLDKVVQTTVRMVGQLLPFFIFGFVSKMQYEGMVGNIVGSYLKVAGLIVVGDVVYTGFLYLLAANFNFKKAFRLIRNMGPSIATGFTTMSSAAALPLTINATNKNMSLFSKSEKLFSFSKSVVPATVNIHLVGDCIAIPVFAYHIMSNYGMGTPSLLNYTIFAFYFVVAKFSVAAVPGGGVIVMLPVLQTHLNFSGDMLALITTLYILLDPVTTVFNILGNGAFAILCSRLAKKLKAITI